MNLSSTQPLFTPVKMGDVLLPNRIVMAPMTRMRASNAGYVPTDLHVEYYAQRASAGLIIGEGTEISPDGYGWADSPGLWSTEQVQGWRRVTDAVHQKGSFMYIQLWHTGAMSHPDFFAGALPMSASAAGIADSIAFGRPYIANPDLPERFITSAQLTQINWPTVYASGPKGYIDYPALLTTPATDS